MAEKDYKSYTENYNLIKPGDLEKYDIEEVTRTNADIIDAELNKHEIAIKNLHNYDDTSIKKDIQSLEKAQQTCDVLINKKVSIEEGKGLSTNDFNNEYKQKLDELKNYDDTEVVQELEKLQQENTELKKTQDDMIEKQLNKQSEVDTSLIVKDTDEFYGKLSIYGRQRQEKRAGINLIDVGKLKAVTKNGINFTPNEDGSININGTATNDTSYFLRDGTLALGIYTYKCFGLPDNLYANCWYCGNAYGEAVKKITSNAENRNYAIELKIPAETTLNVTIEPMLIAGEYTAETFPEYEQFGVMPSLNYSSEIEAVGDKKYVIESGSIEGQEGINIVNQQRLRTKDFIRKAYKQIEVNANGIDKVALFEYDKDKKYIKSNSWRAVPATFELSDNTAFFKYAFRKNDNSNLSVDMITNLEDSNKYIEISTSNKNMYDESKITKGILISVTGTSSNNSHFNLSDFIKVRNSTTYTFSRDEPEKAESQFLVLEYDVQKNFIKRQGNVRNNTNKLTFTTNENTKFVRLQYRVDYAYTDLQFEEEESRTDYIKHRGQTLIMPIQQKMFEGDTFEKIDGVWYEKHNWLELVLDEEKINKLTEQNTDTTGMYRYLYKLTENVSITDKTHAQGYCTHYSMTASSGTYKKEKGFAVSRSTSDKKMYLCIYDEGETLEEFKTKIANKEIKFYLQLEEPLLLKCTAEQSAILDKIDTYKDGTIITTDNDLCKISLRYKEDYDKRITALEKQINTATEVAESE